MGRYSRGQAFLNIAYCLFIFWVTESRPLLAGSFFKLIACVALACLLAFVVVHSANIYKLVIACLHALPRSLFPLAVGRRWSDGPETTIVVTGESSLAPLFQRPPPFLA
jgi:hypothetical protein